MRDESSDVKPVDEGEEFPPLREEDVTAGDKLDDRVQEGEGLPEEPDAA
jgi:hypothetical protein